MQSLSIVYASTSGHTEYVVKILLEELKRRMPQLTCTLLKAEQAGPKDILAGDVLLLASGTWNTGGIEGQLNPHMHSLLLDRAKDIDLRRKPCATIALGDERYFYTAQAGKHLREFITQHSGKECCEGLVIVNEPYGQEEKIRKWSEKVISSLKSL